MEQITNLQNINMWWLFISIVAIMIAVKYLIELFEWFVKKLGLETKGMRAKREEHELVVNTANALKELKDHHKKDVDDYYDKRLHDREQSLGIQKELTDAISGIKETLSDIKQEMLDKNIADLRWTILKFSTDLSNGKIVSRESYDYIRKCYECYEKILEENNMENGLIEESYAYIMERYHEDLANGRFVIGKK